LRSGRSSRARPLRLKPQVHPVESGSR
jgi:hypothetical protein